MTNGQIPLLDYGAILTDLKAKRAEIDKAIQTLEGLVRAGVVSTGAPAGLTINVGEKNHFQTPNIKPANISGLSVYEGAVELIKQRNQALTTKEICQGLLDAGKIINSPDPLTVVSTTLYKSVKKKKNCKISNMGEGKWGLSIWKQ